MNHTIIDIQDIIYPDKEIFIMGTKRTIDSEEFSQDTGRSTVEELEDAFYNGDCSHLAVALCNRFEGLEVHILSDENGNWCHALAYHPESVQFLDIMGVHSDIDVQTQWEDHEWDGIYSADEVDEWWDEFDPDDRYFDDDIGQGVDLVVERARAAGIVLVEKK